MWAEARCIAHVWLRSGHTASGRVRVTRVRADSGFFEEAIRIALEVAALPSAIAARFTGCLQAGVSGLTFRPFAQGLEVAEVGFQARR